MYSTSSSTSSSSTYPKTPHKKSPRTPGRPGGFKKVYPERNKFSAPPTSYNAAIKPAFLPGEKKLRIAVLGGLEEVGRNCTLIEYGEDIIIIDLGLQFPEEDMPGIDYIIPNMGYLKGKEKNIRGVIITHGHYDHIGGIPHLVPQLGYPPIFALPITNAIIKKRQEDYRDLKPLTIQNVDLNTKLQLGIFGIEFFHLNHNIPVLWV